MPPLVGIGSSPPATLGQGPEIHGSRRVSLAALGLTENDVDAAPIRHPPGNSGVPELLVGVRDAPIVLFLELVLVRRAVRISSPPELLDEVLFLDGRRQLLEDVLLIVGDDVEDILLQPLCIGIDLLFLRLGDRVRQESQEGQCEGQETNCRCRLLHLKASILPQPGAVVWSGVNFRINAGSSACQARAYPAWWDGR